MKSNALIGVLGGLGPEATCAFFKKLIKLSHAEKDQDHLEILIYNNPKVPDRTKAIIGEGESPLTAMVNGLRLLDRAGVNIIVIPCVTSHFYLKEMQASVSIPIISVVNEVASYIKIKYGNDKKVGVLATTGSIRGKVFDQAFKQHHLSLITPTVQDQLIVMESIYGADGIKAGNLGDTPKKKLIEIGRQLISRGADILVAGCTEIPLVLSKDDFVVPIVDSLEVLAISTILAAGGLIRE